MKKDKFVNGKNTDLHTGPSIIHFKSFHSLYRKVLKATIKLQYKRAWLSLKTGFQQVPVLQQHRTLNTISAHFYGTLSRTRRIQTNKTLKYGQTRLKTIREHSTCARVTIKKKLCCLYDF